MSGATELTPEPPPRSLLTARFQYLMGELPARIQNVILKRVAQWEADPKYPSLRLHALKDTKKSKHESGSFSISITMQFRAIFRMDGPTAIWYWIGSHADYDRFTGSG